MNFNLGAIFSLFVAISLVVGSIKLFIEGKDERSAPAYFFAVVLGIFGIIGIIACLGILF